jgi:hypothetical protein
MSRRSFIRGQPSISTPDLSAKEAIGYMWKTIDHMSTRVQGGRMKLASDAFYIRHVIVLNNG